MVGDFYTVNNILDPHSLIWQRKNSSPYLTVAMLTGQANCVGRKFLFPRVCPGDSGHDAVFTSPVMVVPQHVLSHFCKGLEETHCKRVKKHNKNPSRMFSTEPAVFIYVVLFSSQRDRNINKL